MQTEYQTLCLPRNNLNLNIISATLSSMRLHHLSLSLLFCSRSVFSLSYIPTLTFYAKRRFREKKQQELYRPTTSWGRQQWKRRCLDSSYFLVLTKHKVLYSVCILYPVCSLHQLYPVCSPQSAVSILYWPLLDYVGQLKPKSWIFWLRLDTGKSR